MRNLLLLTATASVLAIAISAHASARSYDTEARGPPKGLQQAQLGGEPIGPGPPVKGTSGAKPGKKIKQERGKRR